MAQTRQDKAVAAANDLINHMAQLGNAGGFRSWMTDFLKAYNSEQYGPTWAAMATAAQNADGSLGAADAGPTAGHPIDTRAGAQAGLSKAVTAAMLTNAVNLLQQLANFFGNLGVTQGNYSQTVDDLAN